MAFKTRLSVHSLYTFVTAAALLTPVPSMLAAENLARVVGDGEPWEMFVVKRKVSNILVFRPDGVGTISDSMVSIHPTWRAVANGICIRTEPQAPEKCLVLERTKSGIEASQGGKAVFC